MNALNSILSAFTAILMAPFASMPAWVALVFWSAVAGVLMMIAFRYTSNQAALKRVADRTRANMLGMKLFKDDLGVTLACARELFKATGLRLAHSIPPMLVMIVPFVLILAHLSVWYQFRPLRIGEQVAVELRVLPSAWDSAQTAKLTAPTGWEIAPGPHRDAARKALTWQVRARQPGVAKLAWRIGDETIEKTVSASDRRLATLPASTLRPGPNFWDAVFYPAEPAFSRTGPVQEIRIWPIEPDRSTPIFGWDIPWWGTFLIVSMLAALAAKPFVKVQL